MKYSIIASFACTLILCSSLICNAQTSLVSVSARDLENLAVIDNVRHNTLEKLLNHCHTQAGKDYFQRSLRELSSCKEELSQRQMHLQRFVHDQERVFRIRDGLRVCGDLEVSLEVFARDDASAMLLDEFYFKRTVCKSLNNNVAALNASFFLHYVNLFAPLLEHLLLHVGIDALFSRVVKKKQHEDHGHHDHHHHKHKHKGCGCSDYSGLSTGMYYLAQGIHWGMHLPGYYEMATHVQARRKKIEIAQLEIQTLKKYFESVYNLYLELCALDPEFVKDFMPTIACLFEDGSTSSGVSLMATLMNSSWQSSFQSTFNPGAILALHAELKKYKSVLHKVTQEVALLDAYSTVSCLFLERKAYCFVTFIENPYPLIQFEGLWHHAIPREAMRPLSVSLDSSNACSLIRGANGSGKSTMLTAVGQALFLAQSWGIAPAESATITPFSAFYTHSLKRDAIERGLSHFYYEHAYYESLLGAEDKGYTMLLLDEPYTCTDPHVGAEYLATLVSCIKESSTKAALIATHYAS